MFPKIRYVACSVHLEPSSNGCQKSPSWHKSVVDHLKVTIGGLDFQIALAMLLGVAVALAIVTWLAS